MLGSDTAIDSGYKGKASCEEIEVPIKRLGGGNSTSLTCERIKPKPEFSHEASGWGIVRLMPCLATARRSCPIVSLSAAYAEREFPT